MYPIDGCGAKRAVVLIRPVTNEEQEYGQSDIIISPFPLSGDLMRVRPVEQIAESWVPPLGPT